MTDNYRHSMDDRSETNLRPSENKSLARVLDILEGKQDGRGEIVIHADDSVSYRYYKENESFVSEEGFVRL